MSEHELICQEKYAERVGICMDSSISQKQAEQTAWIELKRFEQENDKRDGFVIP